jgi:hypothetical protein
MSLLDRHAAKSKYSLGKSPLGQMEVDDATSLLTFDVASLIVLAQEDEIVLDVRGWEGREHVDEVIEAVYVRELAVPGMMGQG